MTVVSVQAATTVAVDAAALKVAFNKIKPALAKHGVQALHCIRVDASSHGVLLTATNLDQTLSTRIDGIVTEPGSLLVPAKLVAKLLAAYPKGTVEIVGPSEGVEPTVRCKNVSLSFEAVDISEFPELEADAGRAITLNLDAIGDLTGAISTDDSRPILCSVLVRNGTYVATDSHRLHLVETPVDTGEEFLLPRGTALIAAKYKGTVAATVHERNVTIVLDESTTLTSRLIEGQFPLYKNLIPADSPERIELSDGFLADLKALRKVIDGDPSAHVRITQGTGELELSIGGAGSSWKSKVTTPGSVTALADGIGFNPVYLIDLLSGTTSNLLLARDLLKPVVLREAAPELGEGVQRLRLMMPVRTA